MKKVPVIILIVIILLAGAYVLSRKKGGPAAPTPAPSVYSDAAGTYSISAPLGLTLQTNSETMVQYNKLDKYGNVEALFIVQTDLTEAFIPATLKDHNHGKPVTEIVGSYTAHGALYTPADNFVTDATGRQPGIFEFLEATINGKRVGFVIAADTEEQLQQLRETLKTYTPKK